MSRWLPRLLIAVLGVGLVVLLLWAVVVAPPLLIDPSGIADPAKRLDEVSALRTASLAAWRSLPAPSWLRSTSARPAARTGLCSNSSVEAETAAHQLRSAERRFSSPCRPSCSMAFVERSVTC